MIVYSTEEVAEMLKVTPKTVRGYVDKGLLPCIRLNRIFRFTEEDIKTFLEKQRQGSDTTGHANTQDS
ncbi:helix-turn-helix domain-containing protein [Methanospirillum sp.]